MKNSNLENWLNALNEMAGISRNNIERSKHPFETLNTEIEKLISISLKKQMNEWENELKKGKKEAE